MSTPDLFSVLIVDDDELVSGCLEQQLKRHFRVVTAASGEEGLLRLGEQSFDVVISDQIMPNMSGDQFLAEAALRYPHVYRILMTGFSDLNSVIRAVNFGKIGHYLKKPWDTLELARVVKHSAHQSRRSRACEQAMLHERPPELSPQTILAFEDPSGEMALLEVVAE